MRDLVSARSQLYRAARLLGDAQAVRRGRPAQRVARKYVYRTVNRHVARSLRRLGL